MPFDIIAFYESQTATALSNIASVVDDIYNTGSSTTDDLYVKSTAPFLGGILGTNVTGGGASTYKYIEIRQPSLKIPYRTYEGVGYHTTTPERGLVNLFASPLPLYPGEKLNALIQNATAEVSAVFLWLVSGPCSRAEQESVRPTHMITGYCDQTLTAGAWTNCTMTWDQDLPKGKYGVVGMDGGSYVSGGGNYPFTMARLKLLGSKWRPGVIFREMWQDKTGLESRLISSFDSFHRWPLMNEISFDNENMPNIECLSGQARTDHVVNLLLQKIS